MNLSLFSSQDLRRLADLVARKEEFLQAAAQIDSELAAITDPSAVPNVPALPPPSTPPTAERGFVDVFSPRVVREGTVGEQILGVLSGAGPEGAHFRDIADAVSRPVGSVNVWLSAETRRGRYPVRRVGSGRYALKGSSVSRAHCPAGAGGHRSQHREAIVAALKAQPGVPLTYDLLAQRTGLTRRAIQLWLSAHRHELPQLTKVGVGVFVWKP